MGVGGSAKRAPGAVVKPLAPAVVADPLGATHQHCGARVAHDCAHLSSGDRAGLGRGMVQGRRQHRTRLCWAPAAAQPPRLAASWCKQSRARRLAAPSAAAVRLRRAAGQQAAPG